MKRWLFILLIPLLVAIIGGAGYLGFRSSGAQSTDSPEAPPTIRVETCDVEKSVTAPGSLVNIQQAVLDMPVNGKLAKMSVQAGDHVQADQVLAVLDGRPALEQTLNQAKIELLQAQQALDSLPLEAQKEAAQLQLDLLKAQDELDRVVRWRTYLGYPDEIQDSVINKARSAYQLAQQNYEHTLKAYNEVKKYSVGHPKKTKLLDALNNTTLLRDRALAELNKLLEDADQETLVKADADVSLAQAEVEAMARRLNALANGPADLDRQEAEVRLAKAQAAQQEAEEALAALEIKAPFDGVVLEVKARQGETAAEGSPLITMNHPQSLEVMAQVIEEDLPLVQVGQVAKLYFDAAPDAEVAGQVTRIVPQRIEDDRPLYQVFVSLEQVPTELVAGMTSDVVIILERVERVLCLPRALVRAGADHTATVQLWTGDHAEERMIQVGLRGDTNVAILSGLQAGDLVVAR